MTTRLQSIAFELLIHATNPTNATMGFTAVTKGLNAQQYAALTAAVDAFQTTLGRQNP